VLLSSVEELDDRGNVLTNPDIDVYLLSSWTWCWTQTNQRHVRLFVMEQLTNQSTNSISIKVSPRSAETITKCPQPTRSRADISFQWFKQLLKTFLLGCWDRGILWLTVKAAPHKFSYLLTYLALVASSCLALATYLVTQVTGCSNATDRQTDRQISSSFHYVGYVKPCSIKHSIPGRLYGRQYFTGHKTQPTVSKYWRNT